MARPGPLPKPPALKLLEGNPGHRPIPDAPKPPPVAPRQPSWVKHLPGADVADVRKAAADEWKRVVPVLDHLGLLSTIDAALLTDYCLCWARLVQCERALSTEGLVVEVDVTNKDGAVVGSRLARNPHSVTAKEYRSALKSYVGELGLGPSSRGRLNTGGADNADDGDLLD
jgi:P27 family predicted phage terminase small subunit